MFAVLAANYVGRFDLSLILACVFHAFLFVVLLDQLLFSLGVERFASLSWCSPSWIFCAIHVMYFGSSFYGYLDTAPIYAELELPLPVRLLGVFAVFVCLFVAMKIGWRVASNGISRVFSGIFVPAWLIVLFLFLYLLLELVLYSLGYRSVYSGSGYSILEVSDYSHFVLLYLKDGLVIFCALLVGLRARSAFLDRSIFSFIFVGAVLFALVCCLVFFQSARSFVLSVLIFACVPLVFILGLRGRLIASIFLVLFVAMVPFISLGLLEISGRDSDQFTIAGGVSEVNYRLNLSSFSTALVFNTPFAFRSDVITDAAISAVPRGLWPGKDAMFTNAYSDVLSSAGLSPDRDYPDTLFSSGAMVAGWVGLLLYPILFMVGIIWIERSLVRFLSIQWLCLSGLLLLAVMCKNIELGFNELFLHVRHTSFIAGFVLASSYIITRGRGRGLAGGSSAFFRK